MTALRKPATGVKPKALPPPVTAANAVRVVDEIPWQQRVRLECIGALAKIGMHSLPPCEVIRQAHVLEDYVLNGREPDSD